MTLRVSVVRKCHCFEYGPSLMRIFLFSIPTLLMNILRWTYDPWLFMHWKGGMHFFKGQKWSERKIIHILHRSEPQLSPRKTWKRMQNRNRIRWKKICWIIARPLKKAKNKIFFFFCILNYWSKKTCLKFDRLTITSLLWN